MLWKYLTAAAESLVNDFGPADHAVTLPVVG
jgi:hypothetical protein